MEFVARPTVTLPDALLIDVPRPGVRVFGVYEPAPLPMGIVPEAGVWLVPVPPTPGGYGAAVTVIN